MEELTLPLSDLLFRRGLTTSLFLFHQGIHWIVVDTSLSFSQLVRVDESQGQEIE